ncbi:MAG: hypothetical protein M0P73_16290 [Syntrophobacterales bacterium]|jgi:hypothetical protein|nr:hypothetical protein [Syntrophobacterales bacterium]
MVLINNIFPLGAGVVTVNTVNGYWIPRPGERVTLDKSMGTVRVWAGDPEPDSMQVPYTWPRGVDSYEDQARRAAKHYKRKAWWE